MRGSSSRPPIGNGLQRPSSRQSARIKLRSRRIRRSRVNHGEPRRYPETDHEEGTQSPLSWQNSWGLPTRFPRAPRVPRSFFVTLDDVLVARVFWTHVQPHSGPPEKKHAREDCGKDDRAQDQNTGQAECTNEHVRQPSRIALVGRRDINHHRCVGLLLKRRQETEDESRNQFPTYIVLFPRL